jgi:hypothetical protein
MIFMNCDEGAGAMRDNVDLGLLKSGGRVELEVVFNPFYPSELEMQ